MQVGPQARWMDVPWRKCLWFWLLFSNLLVVPSALVSAELGFDQWTTDNGLPHNSINGLIQSSDGYIWLTTTNGIVRFDGVRFRCFLSGITPGIASDTYSYATLLQDKNGDIWAGTANAGVLRFHNNVFTSYSTNEGLPGTNVVRLDQGADGSLWIFTQDGLAQWKDGHIVCLAPKPGSVFNAFSKLPFNISATTPSSVAFGVKPQANGSVLLTGIGPLSPCPPMSQIPPASRSRSFMTTQRTSFGTASETIGTSSTPLRMAAWSPTKTLPPMPLFVSRSQRLSLAR